MKKKVQLRPRMIADAKQINIGPKIKTNFSTNVMQMETVRSTILPTLKENRPSPNILKTRREEDEVDGLDFTADFTAADGAMAYRYLSSTERMKNET
mmetsp:Transcript_1166/g.1304  ORF Transcript_1166/g.1304 Transcript_1166/m.1304 type:complete len:97 (-) Transcript_1166:350-640(-)